MGSSERNSLAGWEGAVDGWIESPCNSSHHCHQGRTLFIYKDRSQVYFFPVGGGYIRSDRKMILCKSRHVVVLSIKVVAHPNSRVSNGKDHLTILKVASPLVFCGLSCVAGSIAIEKKGEACHFNTIATTFCFGTLFVVMVKVRWAAVGPVCGSLWWAYEMPEYFLSQPFFSGITKHRCFTVPDLFYITCCFLFPTFRVAVSNNNKSWFIHSKPTAFENFLSLSEKSSSFHNAVSLIKKNS